MRSRLMLALGTGMGLVLATACSAATVEPQQGVLSINQGQGFVRVGGPIEAKVGDTVMVSPDGSALVFYADGCKVNVQPGAVMTISPISPCAAGSLAQDRGNNNNNIGGYIVGGLGAGALGFGIYEMTQTPGSTTVPPPKPASP